MRPTKVIRISMYDLPYVAPDGWRVSALATGLDSASYFVVLLLEGTPAGSAEGPYRTTLTGGE